MNISKAIKDAATLSAAELKSAWDAADARIAEASARLADIDPDIGGNPLSGSAVGDLMREAMETGSPADVAKLRAEAVSLTDELAMLNAQTLRLMELHTRAEQAEAVQDLPALFEHFASRLQAVTRAQEAFTQAWAGADAGLMDIRHARSLAKAGGLEAPLPDADILDAVRTVRSGPKVEHSCVASWNVTMTEVADSLGLTETVLRDIRTKAAQEQAEQELAAA